MLLAVVLAAPALPLPAQPTANLAAGVAQLLAAERLSDPLRAAAVIQGIALPTVVLDMHTDLHAAWHDAYASNNAPFPDAEHAGAHHRLAAIPFDFAAETAILLSGINHCTRLLARDDAALRLACAIALADLVEERLPSLRAAMAPAPAGEECITGLVRIGTTGDDCYDGAAPETLFSIDSAGNDAYHNWAGAFPFVAALSVDIAGNDIYTNRQGSGLGGGIGILVDGAGSDTYQSLSNPSFQATGMGGVGMLADADGSDWYRCMATCQGSGIGLGGAGILWDARSYPSSDNDVYELDANYGLEGQGFGRSAAVGILLDGSGNDQYSANGAAQGSAKISGSVRGTGLLLDASGDDAWYVADDESRASSIINGNALFLDLGGTDTYSGPSPGANDAIWGPGLTPPTYKRGRDCESGADPLACLLGLP